MVNLLTGMPSVRRFWKIAVAMPVIWAALMVIDRYIDSSAAFNVAWVFKLATIPSIPLLAGLCAERMGEHDHRWKQAAGLWVTIGVGFVSFIALFHTQRPWALGDSAQSRLWPGSDVEGRLGGVPELLSVFDDDWTVGAVLSRELLAIVVIGVVISLVMRQAATRVPKLAAVLVPAATLALLYVYTKLAPWAMRIDFDFFIGDAVLGSTLLELVFFAAPVDAVGAAAIACAALSMGALISAWGGPAESSR